MKRRILALLSFCTLAASCGGEAPPAKPPSSPKVPLTTIKALPEEKHLSDLKQLTMSGENAEAYWAFGGTDLILQSRKGDKDCDQIYRMPLADVIAGKNEKPEFIPISNGKGVTTCSYFFPGDKDVLYASTHLAGEACPPKPDMSQGYVWPLYETFDIFKAKADGSGTTRLTETKGYDAEATVCGKDGTILFTSVRDGDIDLYTMDRDGKNVKRITSTPGYDGGAFFSADCSKIVWRASRPRPGKELDDYKRLLAMNLVRPTKLEIYVANADGSDAQQLTYLDAASFAPYWHPSQKRILFSSNYGQNPRGPEFDIWQVGLDGTGLERITFAKSFDGFPMFSPDGTWLVFSSNRATPEGRHDTNVFLTKWIETPDGGNAALPDDDLHAPDRVKRDIAWLADPAREGRGVGTPGLEASGAYIEKRFQELGFAPAGDKDSFRQVFSITTNLKNGAGTKLAIAGKDIAKDDYVVLGYSPAKANVDADMVYAGYGIVAKDLGVDEYDKLDVKKKVVVVRRFVPSDKPFDNTDAQRRHGDIRKKAFTAREKGAAALVVIDDPLPPKNPLPPGPDGKPADAWKAPSEAKLPLLQPEGYSDAGLPVVVVRREAGHAVIEALSKKQTQRAKIAVELIPQQAPIFNVAGRLAAEPKDGKKLPGVIVIGAHYDHLGKGGRYSLAPHSEEAHVGADDNASGTGVLLEVARMLKEKKKDLRRDVLFVAFSGEESGVLGSAHYVNKWPKTKDQKADGIYAMLNMDMVGRMRENRLQILGAETAKEWSEIVESTCGAAKVECAPSGDGYGPSDQINFFSAGVPVLHYFTGTHGDYHKPSDTADKINAAGAAQTGRIVTATAWDLSKRETALTFKADAAGPPPRGDMRSFNASLGTIPDYGGPGAGKKGVLLGGVRPGSGAEKGGLKKGDILIRLGKSEIASVEDLMFVLNASKPGETVPAVVLRDGKEWKTEVTFQESGAHKPSK